MSSTSPDAARSLAVAAAVLALCLAAIALFFPEGVNRSFAEQAWLPLLVLSVVGFVAHRLLAARTAEATDDAPDGAPEGADPADGVGRSTWRLGLSDLALALLPLVPVLRYVVVNRGTLTTSAVLVVVAGFAVASAMLVIVIPLALTRFADKTVLQVATSALLFVVLNMAAVSDSQAWYETGSVWLQAVILAGTIGVLLLLTRAPVAVFAGAVVLLLGLEVTNAFLLPADEEGESSVSAAATLEDDDDRPGTEGAEPWSARPDISMLVYESYGNQETMAAFGYDNSDQVAFLEAEGFTVYHGTYSVAGASVGTMSRVLQASSTIDRDPLSHTAGHAYVPRLLSSQGYETAGVFYSDYLYGSHQPGYDANFPGRKPPWRPIMTSILRGEFRADESANVADYDEFLAAKREVLASAGSEPAFMYSHNRYPGHTQNSGQCLPEEEEQYFANVDVANQEMRSDVEAANMNDDDAIVVVAGDHGPHLTKNCSILGDDYEAAEIDRIDVQDRYGAFLAIRWPESLSADRRIQVLQDVFPSIFAQLSGDEAFWEDRRIDPVTLNPKRTGGVIVDDGIIVGGADDGEPLFLGP